MYLRDDTVRNHLCECEVEAASKRILCQKPILYTLMKQEVFMAETNTTVRIINSKGLIV